MRHSPRPARRLLSLALAAVSLVILADWLLVDQPVGWSLALLLAATLAVALAAGGLRRQPSVKPLPQVALIAGLLGLAVTMVLEPGVIACGLAVAGLWTLVRWSRVGAAGRASRWLRWMALLPPTLVARPVADFVRVGRAARRRDRAAEGVLTGPMRWAIPLLLACVFVGIFALANPIIERTISEALERIVADLKSLGEALDAGRLALWLGVGAMAWTLMRPRPGRLRWKRSHPVLLEDARTCPSLFPASEEPPPPPSWSETKPSLRARFERDRAAFSVRCLILFNLVFAVQTVLDLTYLLGGASLPENMTYASYAHRGAYPLVAAAILAGLFTLLMVHDGGASDAMRRARLLLVPWIAQSVFLTATAAWRLWLYVDMYGLTRWRLAAAIWMVLVAGGLILVTARSVLRRDGDWLLRRTLALAITVLALCSVPDWEGLIARHNVTYCRELGADAVPLDLAYLESLGPAALPALALLDSRLDSRLGTGDRTGDENAALRRQAAETAARLRDRLDAQLSNWRGWTVRRALLQRNYGAGTSG